MQNQIIKDISILYELSLSVGKSLILKENCHQFLSVLMSRKNLDYCSVWIKNEQFPISDNHNEITAVYANPEIKLKDWLISGESIFDTILKDKEIYSICSTDKEWSEHILEKNIKFGSFAYFRLGDIGFLKIYSSLIENRFDPIELNKLSNIIRKFTISLKACLFHQRSLYNAERKKQAEEIALESENKLSATSARLVNLIQNLQDGILVEDENRRIVVVNEKLINLFNIPATPTQLTGADCSTSADDVKYLFDNPDNFVIRINQILAKQQLQVGDQLQMTNGKFLERDYIPIYINDRYYGHLWQYRDVTENRNLLKELNESSKAAESANNSKSRFLANMSHEIRTPLNAIIGMSKLMENTNLNSEQSSFNQAIIQSSENLLVIINEILDFSKIEAGKLILENVGISISKIVDNVIKTMVFKAEEKNLRLTHYIDPNTPDVVRGDAVRLSQVLMNLLSNALKFTENGFIHVNIRLLEKNSDEKCKMLFTVEDSGIGIEKEKLNLIFEDFNQENSSITREYGGTGLGLSIVKQIIELMSGEIKVESIKNQGSKFSILVPFAIANQSELQERKIIEVDPSVLQSKKILLVDDHEINRFLVVSMLKKWDIEVDEAIHGKDAIDKIKKKDYDIVLMDHQMPIMDGLEATIMIRNELKVNTPIIGLSANALKDTIDKCFNAGMNEYLTKPFEPNQLYIKMINLLNLPTKELTDESNYNIQNNAKTDYKEYDIFALGKMVNDNQEQLKKLLNIFIETTPTMLNEIKEAAIINNYDKISQIVHKMKPSINMMRMVKIQPMVSILEQFDEYEALILDTTISQFVESMHNIVNQISRDTFLN